MALGTFVAGRYTVTYNSVSIGIAEDGHKLSFQYMKEKIENTDAYADAIIDNVYRGANVYLDTLLKEYSTGQVKPAVPYNSFDATGAVSWDQGVVGRLDSDLAQIVVMTVVAGTPAATLASPTTLTASKAILDANFNVEWFFGPRHRKTPIRWQLLPYLSTSVKNFSCT